MDDLITCSKCGDTAERYPSKYARCRPCHNAYQRDYSKKYAALNPQKVKAQRAAWSEKNPEKWLLISAKARAKENGREFSIDCSDIVIPKFCPVLGIELKRNVGGVPTATSPSLDRIDNAKGYVKGNVAVISHRANSLKRNATASELISVALYMGAAL